MVLLILAGVSINLVLENNGIESDVYKIQGNKIVYINKESKKVAERDVDAQLLAFVTEWTLNE